MDAAVAEHGTAGMAVDATDIDVMDVEHGRTAMAVSVVQTGVHAILLQRYQRLYQQKATATHVVVNN